MPDEIKLQHDGEIDIATGKHRRELKWRNRSILWSELLNKLSATQRTHETYKEYLASKKSRQDEIKDVGGFVGAYLQGGRRKHDSVQHRQLITLDIDFAKPDVWEDFKEFDYPGISAAIYSTHKHSDATPRYRLLIPLNRPVLPDEYVAIARRIAGNIGIDQFDHTTYQPERLMYWPSTAKDGDYVFDYTDGDWLDADAVLATYHNWQDSSEWPVSDKESDVVIRTIKKQGDPLEKPGIIGAFCRTYSIHDVIEKFLSDVYEPCDVENRYTYKEGSTAAGLITYDDKFAYSHHGTDPVSGKLCNAFDLVRIHLFGLKDEDAKENTPVNKMPSFKEMEEFAVKDDGVRHTMSIEKVQNAAIEFAGIDTEIEEGIEEETEIDLEWMLKLDADRKGNYLASVDNLFIILENDPALKGKIAFDEFRNAVTVKGRLPWDEEPYKGLRPWTDNDFAGLFNRVNRKPFEMAASETKLRHVLTEVAQKLKFHPVRDYVKSFTWDGIKRVDTFLIDFMGAEDSDYTRAVTRKMLCGAIARVFDKGCKFDYVLTLISGEGHNKSELFSRLGGEWFTDSFNFKMIDQGVRAFEQIQGYWIVETPEMAGLDKQEMTAVKAFITSKHDNYRAAWGRETSRRSRQCIFVGSTNEDDFLRGYTGNRRFWPVPVDRSKAAMSVIKDLTPAVVGQVWAEAFLLYKKGEPLYLSEEMELKASERQRYHTEAHPWKEIIENFLEMKLPAEWYIWSKEERRAYTADFLRGDTTIQKGEDNRTRVSIHEIWNEALQQPYVMELKDARVIKGIMNQLKEWEKTPYSVKVAGYGVYRGVYFRKAKILSKV